MIEKIIAEIERLLNHTDFNNGDVKHGYDIALLDIKRYINSLAQWQKERLTNKTVDYLTKKRCQVLDYDYNAHGGSDFNINKTIEQFKQALEE